MNHEKALELLKSHKLQDADDRRSARIARLSGASAKAAKVLADEHWFSVGGDPSRSSASLLEGLGAADRTAVFTAMQPHLGPDLERMWRDGIGRPYQLGETRRAFRAPNNAISSLPARHARLLHVLSSIRGYEPDAAWVARWAAYLSAEFLADAIGVFLASVIDGGGPSADDVFGILVASAEGEDDIGAMGRHVTRGLLGASRPDGWAFVERMLLAAQRQEGLRQVILESVDDAHPEAFRRMLRLVVDNDLVRFPATVRAIDVWFDFLWAASAGRGLNDVLVRVTRFLEEPAMRDAALRAGAAEDAYLALWCMAFEDAPAAISLAAGLLRDADPGRRYAGVHLLALVGLSWSVEAIAPALDDEDLRIVARALDGILAGGHSMVGGAPHDTFERLERLLARLPNASETLQPIVWPWNARTLDRDVVAGGLVTYLGARDPSRLVPHVGRMEPGGRTAVALKLSQIKRPSGEVRAALITLAGDPAAVVRGAVVEAVISMQVSDDEAIELEALLRRKAGDLRRATVRMLLARGHEKALISADRLLASPDGQQRLGGLEILRRLVESGRSVGPVRDRARAYREAVGEPKLSETERTQLGAILGDEGPGTTSESADGEPAASSDPALPAIPRVIDGFGLLDPAGRTAPLRPRFRGVAFSSDAAVRIMLELDALVHEHRADLVEVETWSGTEQKPLGELVREFPPPPGSPRPRMNQAVPVPREAPAVAAELERGRERLPLHDLWMGWADARSAGLRDADGLEFLRALNTTVTDPPGHMPSPFDDWVAAVDRILGGGREPITIRYPHVVAGVVSWLATLQPGDGPAAFLLDGVEDLLLSVPAGTQLDGNWTDWRNMSRGWRDEGSPWLITLRTTRAMRRARPDLWSAEEHLRLWRLERWIDEGGRADLGPADAGPGPDRADELAAAGRGLVGSLVDTFRKGKLTLSAPTQPARSAPPLQELVAAFRTGAATPDDLIDGLVGPGSRSSGQYAVFRPLATVSPRTPPPFAAGDARFAEIVARIRRRIVDVELRRGEAPTEASRAALALEYSGGLDALIRLVRALGSEPFVRGWSYDGESRQVVFSRLIRSTIPGPQDTPAAFASAATTAGIKERRLVELGCFAPQWADHVESALGWPGLASAIWWMHAHTKDPSWVVTSEIREVWASAIAERTPLDTADLVEGAVDVAWFSEVVGQLGPDRWKVLDGASKYGSTGGGHTRAQLFANAMRGSASEESILARLAEKRHQDSARALGLVPLPDEPVRDEAVLARYRVLQDFIRTSRQFGSSRQASEKRAAEIGLANLARTAGYADPIRLGWAMEARGVADLADGPLTATSGDVEASLAIDDRGEPDLVIRKDGAVVKTAPAEAKKSKEISALRARATDLRRQSSRMRRSLEGAMVRGDAFSGAELIDLADHPLLAPQLRRLVLLGDAIAGYPIAGGRALVDASGREHAIGASEAVRIAHPVDLLAAGAEAWHEWQRDAFRREIVQPFKQVFRELYPATAQEVADGTFSRRYAGHQVGPRQALALLGGRGWVVRPEEGVRKTFHDLRLSAELWFLETFYSPAEVDGLTLEAVRFTRSVGEREPVPIGDVPPRIFSEVMRDLDLVVSVAHAGGVDPEATASTVEMRATLVSETCRLLEIPNVQIDGTRAIIAGSLGEYSVHLGSAVVHRRPGGALFIVPVHAQGRGRLFLPFVDDDPKTAEVLSKVVLLARDTEIRDPGILEQIRRG